MKLPVKEGSFSETEDQRSKAFDAARQSLRYAEEKGLPFAVLIPETIEDEGAAAEGRVMGALLTTFSTANTDAGALSLVLGINAAYGILEDKYIEYADEGDSSDEEKIYH